MSRSNKLLILAAAVSMLAIGLAVKKRFGEGSLTDAQSMVARSGAIGVQGKPAAPLELSYRVMPSGAMADVEISVRAGEDVRSASLTLVLPEGLALRDGALEQQLGAMREGETLSRRIRVEARDSASFRIQATVHAEFLESGQQGSRVMLVPLERARPAGAAAASAESSKVRNAMEAEGAQEAGSLVEGGVIALPAQE